MTDIVTISRVCLQHVSDALNQCKAEVDEALAAPPPPSGLREALAVKICRRINMETRRGSSKTIDWDHAVEIIQEELARASLDDGWVKVDEEHPLPTLFPGDELIVRIQRYTGARSSIEYTHVAYRRRRPSAEQAPAEPTSPSPQEPQRIRDRYENTSCTCGAAGSGEEHESWCDHLKFSNQEPGGSSAEQGG